VNRVNVKKIKSFSYLLFFTFSVATFKKNQERPRGQITDRQWDLDLPHFREVLQILLVARIR
jgi:hypothetical protein